MWVMVGLQRSPLVFFQSDAGPLCFYSPRKLSRRVTNECICFSQKSRGCKSGPEKTMKKMKKKMMIITNLKSISVLPFDRGSMWRLIGHMDDVHSRTLKD
mmetsp:Transcript_30550/g.49027  ORF Transcript_30550/g.49027 Transcript_30550/m.49027 type:complete len:100 (-) Transcript_30550:199-498(-)